MITKSNPYPARNESEQEERDAVEYLTHAMLSVGFLKDLTELALSPKANSVTVGQFYEQWLKTKTKGSSFVPFSVGSVIAYLYLGILFAKERWFDLVPDVELSDVDATWGFASVHVKNPRPMPMRYVIRRIRNSLGHGSFSVDVPLDCTRETIMRRVRITFRDQFDKRDPFEGTFTLNSLVTFVVKFQSEVHRHVREKYDVQPPG